MSVNVGSIGALMVMSVIALWLWRRGERPIKSPALNVALIAMVIGNVLETFAPSLVVKAVKEEGCMYALTGVIAVAHAVSLGCFVGFILTTIKISAAPQEARN